MSSQRGFLATLRETFELSPHEEMIVRQAVETLEAIELLDSAIAEHGPYVSGSAGQLVINPAIPERRQHRADLARLLDRLGVDEGGAPDPEAPSVAGRSLAGKRWGR